MGGCSTRAGARHGTTLRHRASWPGGNAGTAIARGSLRAGTRALLHHLAAAVATLDLQLSDEEVQLLEEPSTRHLPTGFD